MLLFRSAMNHINISNNFQHLNRNVDYGLQECQVDSVTEKALKVSAWAFILILSPICNVLLIATVRKTRSLHSNNSHFMVNIAISDLLVPLFLIPREIAMVFVGKRWFLHGILGSFLCKFVIFAGALSIPVSVLTMVVIAVERFHCVVFPLKPHLISPRSFRRLIAFIWIVSALLESFNFFVNELREENGFSFCMAIWEDIDCSNSSLKEEKTELHKFLGNYLLLSIAPLIILTAIYTVIVIKLYRHNKTLNLAPQAEQQRNKKKLRVTLMSLTMVVAFVVVWAPFWFVSVKLFFNQLEIPEAVLEAAKCLPHTYTIVNPVIFYIFNETFRNGVNKTLKCS